MMRVFKSEMLPGEPPCEPHGPEELIAEITKSASDIAVRSAAALAQVRSDIIVGEGPTVSGRLHFSRTIDADDAALCAHILMAAGHTGLPVSRAEVDALFAIDAAGSERCDDGRFDDLLAKAVMHHLMSAAGAVVPSRESALATENLLAAWASAIDLDREQRSWLACHLGPTKPASDAARAINAVLHIELGGPQAERPFGVLFDIAA
jgi:hypothetical protein